MPGSTAGAELEDELAHVAAAILKQGGDSKLDDQQRAVLTAAKQAHVEHAIALRATDPTTRPTNESNPPTATPQLAEETKSSTRKAIESMIKLEFAAAESHRKSALAATGFDSLLWGSLSASASQYADALQARRTLVKPPAAGTHHPLTEVSAVVAMQALVTQSHAIIYGYRLASAQFGLSSGARKRADARLRQHRVLKDQVSALLLKQKAEVPVAEAAYRPSTSPTDPASATALLRHMETAFLPFCGQWLAAVQQQTDRQVALAALTATTLAAAAWGGPLQSWPGWQD